MTRLRWLWLPLLLSLWLVAGGPSTHAQQPTPNLDDQTLRVAKDLYCPVCPGVPLDVCGTQACRQWRALIREKLAAGQSEEQIRQFFYQQYGERVLGAPVPAGFNLGVYLLPFLVLLGGVAVLVFTVRGWVRSSARRAATPSPQGLVPPSPLAPGYADRIARDLQEDV